MAGQGFKARVSLEKEAKLKLMPVLDLKKEMVINMYLVQVTQTLLNAYVSTRTLDFLLFRVISVLFYLYSITGL